jgi:hypothetical protein
MFEGPRLEKHGNIAGSTAPIVTRKLPLADPQHYLLSPAAGRAALKKLSLTYPDPVEWINNEQQLNDRAINKGDYPIIPNSVPPDFWPEQQPVFWLPEFEAPGKHFRLFQSQSKALPWYLSGSDEDFQSHLVHPLTVQYFLNRKLKDLRWRNPRFLGTPMASHRTLLVWNPRSRKPPFSIKTSVNVWIGGLNRNVQLREIRRSVGISSLFAGIPKADLNRQGILLLDDSVGLLHKQTNAGLLSREAPSKLGPGEEIVPIFSLVASRQGKLPRVVGLVRSGRLGPTTWVDRFILKPLIYQAYFLGMTEGLVGEMHEQNILMELREGKPTRRFWHRDQGGFGVDRELRRLANKGLENLPKGIHERHLGARIPLLHLLLRMYLQGSLLYVIACAMRDHFKVSLADFDQLYNVRVREFQNRLFSENGISQSGNVEKDLELYRKRRRPGCCNWRWKSLEEGLRDW